MKTVNFQNTYIIEKLHGEQNTAHERICDYVEKYQHLV
jgi:hypothetical protein